jgi:hypothetical protein
MGLSIDPSEYFRNTCKPKFHRLSTRSAKNAEWTDYGYLQQKIKSEISSSYAKLAASD